MQVACGCLSRCSVLGSRVDFCGLGTWETLFPCAGLGEVLFTRTLVWNRLACTCFCTTVVPLPLAGGGVCLLTSDSCSMLHLPSLFSPSPCPFGQFS
ncbi:hypothetical protein L207DRAFT_21940 [Hyaloscypha variabilis F]|uniref:Uncharacterized protein n=1 Tax=Hyaloscypha variabilis (strain UAMH 11265 / GT02V1 / F) TaxID=1149755 RepID=A0A2J6RLP7_HYAVF|nr:hypothetical protein L207DRAFT_21940 [Hyaloscypha variabilis F]